MVVLPRSRSRGPNAALPLSGRPRPPEHFRGFHREPALETEDIRRAGARTRRLRPRGFTRIHAKCVQSIFCLVEDRGTLRTMRLPPRRRSLLRRECISCRRCCSKAASLSCWRNAPHGSGQPRRIFAVDRAAVAVCSPVRATAAVAASFFHPPAAQRGSLRFSPCGTVA